MRVVLTGDDPLLYERLRQEARRTGELEIIAAVEPVPGSFDAVLLPALGLPGREEMRRLKARGGFAIGYGRPEHVRAAFLAGCDDYLKDPWNAVELACRLERLCRVDAAAGRERASAGGNEAHCFPWGELRLEGVAVCSPEGCLPLSLPESRILAVLLRHRGQPVAREVLYYAIWGRSSQGRSRAVDVHVSSLRGKLLTLFPGSAGCLRSLRGTGYCLG